MLDLVFQDSPKRSTILLSMPFKSRDVADVSGRGYFGRITYPYLGMPELDQQNV